MSDQQEKSNPANQNSKNLNPTNLNLNPNPTNPDLNLEIPRQRGDGEESASQILIAGLPPPPSNQNLAQENPLPPSTNPLNPPPYVDQSTTTIGFIQNPIGGFSGGQAPPTPTTFPLLGSGVENPPVDFLAADNPQSVNPLQESSATAQQQQHQQVPLITQSLPQQHQQILWKPNRKLLTDITGLGFSEICAEKALFYTGNESADLAVGWILDNPDSQTDQTPLCFEGTVDDSREASRGSQPSSTGSSPGPIVYDQWRPGGGQLGQQQLDEANMFKMVFAVNSSLKMGLGKIAAQVGHATLGLYRNLERRPAGQQWLNEWRETGETKIVLRADNTEQLSDLERRASLAGLQSYLVLDAGRTQIAAGSATVISIFGPSAKVDEVTGALKLL